MGFADGAIREALGADKGGYAVSRLGLVQGKLTAVPDWFVQREQTSHTTATMDFPADDQDWTPVVMKKRRGAGAGAAAGAGATTSKANHAAGAAHLRAVEAADVPLPPAKRLSATGKTAIIQGRLAKKWTQDQLNKECALPPGTINAIEAGRAQPSGAQLNAISRALNVVLRFE
jgi:hypothetical protein